jgi:[acyl-carrier-protein] S-malonyltransferase
MANQSRKPVYWQETMENMIADGIRIFIEIGPGNTLCGLAKKINHDIVSMNIEDYETLKDTIEILKNQINEEEAGENHPAETKEV